jgi:hypothetical protein
MRRFKMVLALAALLLLAAVALFSNGCELGGT